MNFSLPDFVVAGPQKKESQAYSFGREIDVHFNMEFY